MGYGSVAIINGDLSQIDLPKQIESGLSNILKVTKNIKNIGVTKLTSADVIRHPLVREIIDAYDKYNSD
jgi:phosphate starvation-inducible PhoH-like protein